jgi:hypothetical protein
MGFIRQTGVTYSDPDNVYNTFVIFTGADSITRLIDLNGSVVQKWEFPGMPARVLDPGLSGGKKGNLLLQLSSTDDPRAGVYSNRTIGQVDWDGKRIWEWGSKSLGGAARQNHDWQLLPNGNWLLLVTVLRVVDGFGPKAIGDQSVVEVSPDGTIVWSWSSGDHISELGLSDNGLSLLYEAFARDPNDPWGPLEWNSASTLGPNKWYYENPEKHSVFHPDNIIIGFRKINVVAIIDKSSGNVVWRLGPYFEEEPGDEHHRVLRYNVPRPLDQISGQHNPHIIPKGLPGAGNVLIFDCQGAAGFPPAALGKYSGSRILEVNPVTKEIVWQYTAEDSGLPPWTFFSSFVSNAQRLPNGNTHITEGMTGRLFQVTPKGKVVWEYYSPYTGYGEPGIPGEGEPETKEGGRAWTTPLVYRSQAVPNEWLPHQVKRAVVKALHSDSTPSLASTSLIKQENGNAGGVIPFIRELLNRWWL